MFSFPAHVKISEKGEEIVQTLGQHSRRTAVLCQENLSPSGLGQTGELLGLLHDMGKFSHDYEDYLLRAVRGEPVRRGSVNHTFAGVRLLLERYHQTPDDFRRLTCELLAFASGSHHGLFDCFAPDGCNGFLHRLQTQIPYIEIKENFFQYGLHETALDQSFDKATAEVTAFIKKIAASICSRRRKMDEFNFAVSLLARLILSALIDADRQDTAEFMFGQALPCFPEPASLWNSCLLHLENQLKKFPSDTPIQTARQRISAQCAAFGKAKPGIYRLSVPTGAGKTLAGLRAAITHAKEHGSARIFFLTPLLSVLDQNAQVIREALPNQEWILEHHSNVIRDIPVSDELNVNELLTENWKAPIVITTLVQFLNTLFHGRTSCIRRMQSLIHSVIVLDEVQSVPQHLISLFNQGINFLAEFCGCTIILCSATQPCLEQAEHPMICPEDLIPYNESLWLPFRRTRLVDLCTPAGYAPEELAALALKELPIAGSVLIICNKKSEAAALYTLLKEAPAKVFHLSTSMCMSHRREVIAQIKGLLEVKEDPLPVLCISTQLVEAGVDFSFGCVIRLQAGMDSVLQAAGRCNRSGEKGHLCPVYLVNWKKEDLTHLNSIQLAKDAMGALQAAFSIAPEKFGYDLQSEASVQYYYRTLYKNMAREAQDFPVPRHNTSIFQMLSDNYAFWTKNPSSEPYPLRQAFKTAGKAFQVFDDNTEDVLVPYREGEALILDFCSARARQDLLYRKGLLAKSRFYTISLFEYQIRELMKKGGIYSCCDDSVLALRPEYYSVDTGLNMNSLPQKVLLINTKGGK